MVKKPLNLKEWQTNFVLWSTVGFYYPSEFSTQFIVSFPLNKWRQWNRHSPRPNEPLLDKNSYRNETRAEAGLGETSRNERKWTDTNKQTDNDRKDGRE